VGQFILTPKGGGFLGYQVSRSFSVRSLQFVLKKWFGIALPTLALALLAMGCE
jgi:hypothetical protein